MAVEQERQPCGGKYCSNNGFLTTSLTASTASGGELTQFDPEIEGTFDRQKNTIERGENSRDSDIKEQLAIIEPAMDHVGAVERPMMKYSFPASDGMISSIAKPTVQANNFEIKPFIIQIIRSSVQFSGLLEEDPNKHLSNFLKYVIPLNLMVLVMMLLDLEFSHFHYVMLQKIGFQSLLLLDRESLFDAWCRCNNHIVYSNGCTNTKLDNLGAAIWNGAPIGPCGACGRTRHLSQYYKMPSYAKVLKKVISNKRKWEGGEMVKLNEECSTILQISYHQSSMIQGVFSIPCTTGNTNFDKVLCDLRASVNLMSYSIFEKVGMYELTPTIITLQLADRSIKYPRGIVEDVLVKVGKFIIPVDFIVLDMEEDMNMPLRKSFLAASRALIDVQKCQLTLELMMNMQSLMCFKP
ncbi:hypothetical protein Sango_0806200 [Sesamum angolense]|uniref:Uncharacterized protein n=1 Tax=Sesamum angolense TaxID=2727404 RepID=A0AAE2C0D2_9LAMI|nr:hypothetical protein Sango_0806200 [Sesamum angolense]